MLLLSIKAHGHMCIYLSFVFGVQCIAHVLLGDANDNNNKKINPKKNGKTFLFIEWLFHLYKSIT